MRIAILTTQTSHHARFVEAMAGMHDLAGILVETAPAATASFDTAHPFEAERDAYERDTWFAGNEPLLREFASVQMFTSLNEPAAAKALSDLNVEAAIVFGTGRLKGEILNLLPQRLLNLHGGDPQDYRGLDSHLWAVYHNDFKALVSCLHFVEPELDTGAVLNQRPVPLTRGMELHQLRHANTETCIDVSNRALASIARGGMMTISPIQRRGRYYSFMPSVLKGICVAKFHRHTENLP
ncbi:MAG: formyltransferase family protein [Rhodospirillales bacterium]